MTMQNIVREWLKANGYDGLCDTHQECGCSVNDLMPCSEPGTECEAGYKKNAGHQTGFDFVIVPGRRPDGPLELLKELLLQINTVHLDMGGNNKYCINVGGHKVIDKIKAYLYAQS